jgi:hypothetical protein
MLAEKPLPEKSFSAPLRANKRALKTPGAELALRARITFNY